MSEVIAQVLTVVLSLSLISVIVVADIYLFKKVFGKIRKKKCDQESSKID